tara:strand:+ start:1128 stop:1451 length:324 start_codon:yes stop_codon:yes gene_type:complete
MIPGEYILMDKEIELNKNQKVVKVIIENSGDRPVQIGSHFHFFEVNTFLKFDRKKAYGRRLNIPSGTAVRFEPGQSREVELISYEGNKIAYGFNSLVNDNLKEGNNV